MTSYRSSIGRRGGPSASHQSQTRSAVGSGNPARRRNEGVWCARSGVRKRMCLYGGKVAMHDQQGERERARRAMGGAAGAGSPIARVGWQVALGAGCCGIRECMCVCARTLTR